MTFSNVAFSAQSLVGTSEALLDSMLAVLWIFFFTSILLLYTGEAPAVELLPNKKKTSYKKNERCGITLVELTIV
jgi:hypothetical protein